MKTASQLVESIERFQRVFWDKRSAGRPPVGVVNTDIYLPIKYLRRPLPREFVAPADLGTGGNLTDYQFAFADRPVNCDDWIPFAAPWRAIPWLEAWCGCPVQHARGSLKPAPSCHTAEALVNLPAHDEWFTCLCQQTQNLLEALPDDCWVSPTILRGCSDVLGALRGLPNLYCDLYDAPELIDQAAARIQEHLRRALDQHFALVPPKRGGYGHIFGYWAPGPTIALQEDALGMCRPTVFRDIFQKYNADLVQHLGPYVLFHLHSTGFQHYRHVLEIPGLAGLQLTVEANGPPLLDMLPALQEILSRSRLLLFVDHRFDELPAVLPHLPHEGLYLVIPETCLDSDDAYRRFVSRFWSQP
jgi:hypothetical protein